ncbi:MAG: zinc-ribbon domain-containing protein [Candidatus Bathyarchaeia archaeon]
MTEVKAKFCQYCGRELSTNAIFCPNCGKSLASIPSEKTVAYVAKPAEPERPSEVIIISILMFIDGLAWMAVGLTLGSIFKFFSMSLGVGVFVIGMIVGLLVWFVAIGLLMMQGWAYILALVFASISLLLFPIGTILGIIFIWLLLKSEVKEAFRKR